MEHAVRSAVSEWLEAPWFVILAIAVAAFVLPGIAFAVGTAILDALPI